MNKKKPYVLKTVKEVIDDLLIRKGEEIFISDGKRSLILKVQENRWRK